MYRASHDIVSQLSRFWPLLRLPMMEEPVACSARPVMGDELMKSRNYIYRDELM